MKDESTFFITLIKLLSQNKNDPETPFDIEYWNNLINSCDFTQQQKKLLRKQLFNNISKYQELKEDKNRFDSRMQKIKSVIMLLAGSMIVGAGIFFLFFYRTIWGSAIVGAGVAIISSNFRNKKYQ